MLKVLQSVLDRAHSGHSYVADTTLYTRPEYWEIGLIGDCEDFALWCREELRKIGVDSQLIYCKTETEEGHLVCAVDGWILDNRYSWVMNRNDLNYTWISVGCSDGVWRKLI